MHLHLGCGCDTHCSFCLKGFCKNKRNTSKKDMLLFWFPGPPLPYQTARVLPRDRPCLWGTPRGLATPACVLSLTNCSVPGGYHRVTSPTHCCQDYLHYVQDLCTIKISTLFVYTTNKNFNLINFNLNINLTCFAQMQWYSRERNSTVIKV